MPALLAVLAAFMAGLALGAWVISKIVIRNCGQCYAWLELSIGAWAVCTAVLLPAVNRLALTWIGLAPSSVHHWFIAFLIPLVVLLPATACMGATLPVIERLMTPLTTRGQSVAGLYAANTFGAVVGVLASTFFILPQFGLRSALFAFAALNICCGLIVFALTPRTIDRVISESFPKLRRPGLTLFVTGFLGIGYEVVGVRLLAQVLEGTVYTYAAVLAVFLLGTALGAAVYQRIGQRTPLPDLLSLTALACAIGILGATQADELYRLLRAQLGDGMAGVLFSEMAVATSVFFLPTALMGATFSHLAHSMRQSPGGIGRAVAINTLGAAGAPLLVSVLLLPWFGSKWTLLIIAGSYALIAGTLRASRWVAAISVALLALLPATQLRFLTVPAGGRLLAFEEGVMASVAVVEDALAHKSLRVDNRFQMGGTGVAEAEYRHAHIPLLLHPKPKRALFLGLGTGITFDAAALHAGITADGVELLREVVDVMPRFSPYNDSVRTNTRLAVFVADARRFVRGSTNVYDVIVGDLFHPARDGAGSLYTLEHFRSIRERLADDGLFCQWLPLHQLDVGTLRVVIRTFLEVFPNAQAWLLRFNVETPVMGLIGGTVTITYTPDWIERRDAPPSLAAQLQKLALGDSLRLFGNILCGPGELSAMANTARINTDDNSAVLFGAPAFTYRDDAPLHNPVAVFLDLQLTNTATLLGFNSPDLERFIAARNVFLRGLIDEAHGRMAEACERYIESARVSDNFTAGYARVVTIAAAEAASQPERSRKLLEQLIEAQPARPVARQLLGRLFPERAPTP
jgi:spermidine synthase